MATATQHYQRAEELLFNAYGFDAGSDLERGALAAAQVHATLALAATTLRPAAIAESAMPQNEWRR